MKKKTISKDECRAFNEVRQIYVGQELTSESTYSILKNLGFKDRNYLKKFVEFGALEKPSYNHYKFTAEPVHIDKLNNIVNSHRTTRRGKKSSKDYDEEEEAIKFLKLIGYEIRKPVIDEHKALLNPDKPVKEFIKMVVV